MMRIRLQYVNSFRDRHGQLRRYFRRPGCKSVAPPGLPGSAEFLESYQAALAGDTAPRIEIGASRTRPGTYCGVDGPVFQLDRISEPCIGNKADAS
jgi:hypothetical protein